MTTGLVLQDLLEEVMASEAGFPASFYARLFVSHPELKPMFHRSSPDAQQKMFAQKLMLLVDAIDSPERLRRELQEVANTHRAYGITREMYDWVGEALVGSVADALKGRMTVEQRAALTGAWQTMTTIIFEC